MPLDGDVLVAMWPNEWKRASSSRCAIPGEREGERRDALDAELRLDEPARRAMPAM